MYFFRDNEAHFSSRYSDGDHIHANHWFMLALAHLCALVHNQLTLPVLERGLLFMSLDFPVACFWSVFQKKKTFFVDMDLPDEDDNRTQSYRQTTTAPQFSPKISGTYFQTIRTKTVISFGQALSIFGILSGKYKDFYTFLGGIRWFEIRLIFHRCGHRLHDSGFTSYRGAFADEQHLKWITVDMYFLWNMYRFYFFILLSSTKQTQLDSWLSDAGRSVYHDDRIFSRSSWDFWHENQHQCTFMWWTMAEKQQLS